MPHTYLVRDFAPKLAARFGKSLISDCIRAQVAGGTITFTRRIFLGKLDADVVSDGEPPVFATFQSGAYRPDQAAKGSGAPVETMAVEVGEIRMTPEAPFQEVKQAVDLTQGGHHRRRRSRHQEQRQSRAGGETCGSAGRRPRCVASDLRRRVAADRSADWIVRTNRRAEALRRAGNLRRDSASGRHEKLRNDRGDQQRSRSADLRHR